MSENLKRLEAEAEARAKRLADEFSQKINGLKDQIGALEIKKLQIQKGRISKAEAMEAMLGDLQEGYEAWVGKFLTAHLRTYQQRIRTLKDLDHIRTHFMQGLDWLGFLLFSSIRPEMVNQAAATLDEGPSAKERARKIEEFDKEIRELEKQMEGLLK